MKIGTTAGRESRSLCYTMMRTILIAGTIAGVHSAALAADDDPASSLAGAEELMDVPGDLPGHERAPRSRQEARDDAPSEPAPPEEEREWFGGMPWFEWSRATGDWGGWRTTLEDKGLSFAGSYTLDWTSVVDGGINQRASTRQIFDVNATLDLDAAFDWTGAKAFVDFYIFDGRGGFRDVGDYAGVSTIDGGKNLVQVGELWLEQALFDGVLRLKAGKIDAAKEFDFLNVVGGFLNLGAVQDPPSYPGLATYPNPATGVVAFVYPTDWLYAGAGWFDGATADGFRTGGAGPATFFSDSKSDAWFFIGEVGVTWDAGKEGESFRDGGLGAGRLAVGAWQHTADFATFAGGTEDGQTGFFAVAEQQLVRRGGGDDDAKKGLFAFARLGFADESTNPAAFSLAGGLSLAGTFVTRADDGAGVLVSFVDMSDDAGAGFDDDELAFELYYKVGVTPFFTVTPDVQYIMSPGGNSTVDDAIQVGVRVGVSF